MVQRWTSRSNLQVKIMLLDNPLDLRKKTKNNPVIQFKSFLKISKFEYTFLHLVRWTWYRYMKIQSLLQLWCSWGRASVRKTLVRMWEWFRTQKSHILTSPFNRGVKINEYFTVWLTSTPHPPTVSWIFLGVCKK